MTFNKQAVAEAAAFIRSRTQKVPKVAMILGSGLGSLADEVEDAVRIPYSEIPFFPVTTVHGHAGLLVIGELEGQTVIAMQGRFHFYEGNSMQQLTFPVRVMRELGAEILLVTNAAGAINPELKPGSLMLLRDHINFMGDNPLIGPNDDSLGPRFPDMSEAYDRELMALAHRVADADGVNLYEGVYTAVSGPYYFSRAELRMVRTFGSDTIGMSTVPETIVAVHSGMRVLGICCVTDSAVPELLQGISHEEVIEVANRTRPVFTKLMKGIVRETVRL
jgi:purine-nucleoside phosphorylase